MTVDQRSVRIKKLEELRKAGINPFPYRFEVSHRSEQVKENFESLEQSEERITLAGRVMTIRVMGKAGFCHIQDDLGQIQLYFKKDVVGDELYALYKQIDIGDLIGCRGKVFRTKKGEMSIWVESFEMLAKSLRPLPEKWHGLKDVEMRYRQRYLDLISNREVKEIFLNRAKIIRSIRDYLDNDGFVEVETPILQPLYGGGSAEPFTTHHNRLGMELYLRIADELYLKRLIIGGFEKVYEVCKDFRNEGLDRTHNPEFTMIELYQAYVDYNDIMELMQKLLVHAAREVLGRTTITYKDEEIELDCEWERLPMLEAIKRYSGIDAENLDEAELKAACKEKGIEVEESRGRGKIIDDIFTEKVQPNLIRPTFITDHPIEMSPLAKVHRDDPRLTERFELFICEIEVANAFSELNDPLDQRERFAMQKQLSKLGDKEAQVMDEDFLRALEHGMPPTGGLGFGVDRVVMLLTNQTNIREVLLFPQLKPE
ncbi:MAG: lysine--tRNA ligase [candidate division Zixibacteria bacterium]|nr:lysine--tRNA ligase [candidate division Zixibacteria bacterium]MBU1469195.1 lysine--tRNA ligase [candidate division Zixibacteria bacterium]MBU2626567.1 lysine--tRNA ligase [candidate division Zixibacteria bacterium]